MEPCSSPIDEIAAPQNRFVPVSDTGAHPDLDATSGTESIRPIHTLQEVQSKSPDLKLPSVIGPLALFMAMVISAYAARVAVAAMRICMARETG